MFRPDMRAAILSAFGPIELVQVGGTPAPKPAPGEVLVMVHAAPVNYVDLVVINGLYQFLPPLPFTPGKGPAGVIIACGPGVYGFEVGDRVLAMAEQGGYAEQVVVKANQCYRLPNAMSFAEAASMSLAYDTAWFALRERARIRAGETVLVLGSSGAVGLAAIQLAKAMGCVRPGGHYPAGPGGGCGRGRRRCDDRPVGTRFAGFAARAGEIAQ